MERENVFYGIGKANVQNSFFSIFFTDEDLSDIPVCEMKDTGTKLESIAIDSEDVQKQLLSLNPNKSPGPNGFHPRVLKEIAVQLAEPLALVFEKSLWEGDLCSDWKEAQVRPVFKKEEKSSLVIYRPVSPIQV